MSPEQLIGVWGFDQGYRVNPNETRITFEAAGSGYVSHGDERMEFQWLFDAPDQLRLSFAEGHWYGPYTVRVERTNLPLGEFTSLISNGSLLPFGLRQFQRVEAPGA
jgi:hypothetical protein